MPHTRKSSRPENPINQQEEALCFLKKHLSVKQIMSATRQRFTEIDQLLLAEQINKHDRGHQMRTAVNATRAMRLLGFEQREMLQAAAGALFHDIGYGQPDTRNAEILTDDYHGGNRAKFKKHALFGAHEAHDKLTRILAIVRKHGQRAERLKDMISFKDENGQTQLMDEQDIERIAEAILNHNDYGKDEKDYDPRLVGKGALMVQLFDKLDICRQRVYTEHMNPSAFLENSECYDPKYFHRVVPYCIRRYDFTIDPEDGILKMTYKVDLEPFQQMMRTVQPDFEYGVESFIRDFSRAYDKNLHIAAEAIGVITDRPTSQQALQVIFEFPDGKRMKSSFSRPERRLYQAPTEALRVQLVELLRAKKSGTIAQTGNDVRE